MKIQKVYAWSIVLEPMIFFTVTHQGITGVGANISRILQAITLFFLIASICIGKRNPRFPNPMSFRYYLLTGYFCLALISALVGIFMGVYSFEGDISEAGNSFIALFLRSPYVRPLFEYFIFFYYVVYFAIFPIVFFKKEEDIIYFFRVFFFMFNLSLVIGLVDLFFVAQYDITITSRELFEWYTSGPVNVGFRFHGFFGEPRDAFVVLGLGAAFYYLRSSILNYSQSKHYYMLLIICALLTQSASGLLGVILFVAIYGAIYSFRLKYLWRNVILTILFGIVLYVGIIYSPRNIMIFDALLTLRTIYETGGDLPPTLMPQQNDINPIFWLLNNLFNLNLIPVLLGTGLGSASHINKVYAGLNEFNNPNSNIVRIVSETGIIGLFIYIKAFYSPVKRAMAGLPIRKSKNIILFSLLVLSLSLSHRSASNFIFLGIFFAIMKVFPPENAS